MSKILLDNRTVHSVFNTELKSGIDVKSDYEHRFNVALSFASEHRSIVANIANGLANVYGEKRVLYDNFHKAEFARPNLDLYLQKLYRDESRLIVVFLGPHHDQKSWCGLEWRSIRDLLNQQNPNERIMFVSVGENKINDFYGRIDGYVTVHEKNIDEVIKLILDRYSIDIKNKPSDIEKNNLKLLPINEEFKRYFSLHPEKLYNLTPRKFEELIADVLKDFGFDVELTSATRDGGFDIYAYMKTQIGIFLTFVECKRWTPPNHVGIEIVQRLQGVQHTNNAHNSMIVTTSYFTEPAILASRKLENSMKLVDYNNLKEWLERYK